MDRRLIYALAAGAALMGCGGAPEAGEQAAPATAAAAPPPAGAPALTSPIACEVGRTCFIQHYVDVDPTPEARDYRCGPKTYEAHDGIDFRLPTLAAQRAGVEVRAAAAGVVAGARDGMPDRSVREDGQMAAVESVECGNGVRIEHANGWETQYCHMANGSIAVRPGQRVTAGQRLGVVGLSGQTEFPHLHFTVRQNGRAVDPFAYGAPAGACGERGASLWAASAQGMAYKAPEVINFGFAPGPVTMADIDSGAAQASRPNAASPALVVWVRANGLEAGDEQALMLEGPEGAVLAENVPPPLERSKAQYFLFTGKANRGGALRPGVYIGRYVVRREGRAVLEQTVQLPIG